MGINVISFFDGISAGQQSLSSLGIEVDNYIAVEIDEEARIITKSNFPKTIFWGDITQLVDNQQFYESLPKIDLIFAGSPCQGFSKGGKMKGLEDPRSALFSSFTFIFNQIKKFQGNPHIPFFFENVVMDEQWEKIISRELGVSKPAKIQASDYSPTSRKRLYWTNMHIPRSIMDKYAKDKDSGIVCFERTAFTKCSSILLESITEVGLDGTHTQTHIQGRRCPGCITC